MHKDGESKAAFNVTKEIVHHLVLLHNRILDTLVSKYREEVYLFLACHDTTDYGQLVSSIELLEKLYLTCLWHEFFSSSSFLFWCNVAQTDKFIGSINYCWHCFAFTQKFIIFCHVHKKISYITFDAMFNSWCDLRFRLLPTSPFVVVSALASPYVAAGS